MHSIPTAATRAALLLVTLLLCAAARGGETLPADRPAASAPRALERAEVYLRRMDFAGAKELIEDGLEANPFYIPLWLAKAKAETGLGNHAAAEEALGVVLEAEPRNRDANIIAFDAAFDPSVPADPRRQKDLLRRMGDLDAELFYDVVVAALLSAPDMALRLEPFLAARRAADGADDALQSVLEAYSKQRFREAAGILSEPDAEKLPDALEGALNLALGKVLPWVGETRRALARLDRAKALAYETAEADRQIGLIHIMNSDPAKAAAAFERAWRGVARPLDTVLDAVAAYVAAGEQAEAVRLVEAAQKTYPDHPGLRGEKLLALRKLGDSERFNAYGDSLKALGDAAVPALRYYRSLLAWENGDFEGYVRETAALRAHLDSRVGDAMAETSVDHWMHFGDWMASSRDMIVYRGLADISQKLWSMERYADALAVRETRARLGAAMGNSGSFTTAVSLLDREMPRQADALLRRNAPRLDGMDAAVRLYDAGRLSVAYGMFALADGRNPGSVWTTLYLADIAVRTNETEDAAKHLRALWSLPAPSAPLPVKSPGDNDEIAVRFVPASVFRNIELALADRIVRSGEYTELYDAMLGGTRDAEWRFALIDLMLRMGQLDAARKALGNVLAANPGDSRAHLQMALAEYMDGRTEDAKRFLADGLNGADDATREYILALQSRFAADRQATAEHLLKAVELNPADPHIRGEAVQALVDAHRYKEAQRLTEQFEIAYAKNAADVGSFLAAAYTAIGKLERSEQILGGLVRRFPYSRAPLASLGDVLNRLERPRETIEALSGAARKNKDPEYSALIAEAHLSLGEKEEALDWVEYGLTASPKDTRLIRLGAQTAEAMTDYPLIEEYAKQYIEIDSESAAMQYMYGQTLLDQKKWDEMRRHNAELLLMNPLNIGALEREAEWAKALEDPKQAAKLGWQMDRCILKHYHNDPSLIIRGSISAAGDSDFRFAIPTLQCMVDLGPNSMAQSVYFSGVSTSDVLGGVPIGEVMEKLQELRAMHDPAGLEALARGVDEEKQYLLKTPLVIFVGRSTPKALKEFDARLAETNGCAVLIVGEESLSDGTAFWADAALLRELAATGRWQFVLSDYAPVMLPNNEGKRTNFWLQAKWLDGQNRFETREEMRLRVSAAMNDLRAKAAKVGIPVGGWAHPSWGDYGQRILRREADGAAAYMDAVRENFPLAMTMVPGGQRIPTTDPYRIPMRSVGAGVDTKQFIDSVDWNHPTRRAVLELAKTKSWHGQLPAAQDLFCRARSMNLDEREVAYFHARNFEYEGDVPMAIAGAHEAFNLDPENPRTTDLMQDAHRLRRPLLTGDPSYSVDSDDEQHIGLDASLGFHVSNRLELRVLAGFHRWWNDDGRVQATALGAGARYYFAPQNWVLGEVRGFTSGNSAVGSYAEMRLQWHGAYNFEKFFKTNGFFDLSYNREAVQTQRAMAAGGVFADRLSFNTTARVCNWWEIDAGADYITRSDGNDTWEVEFRPTYRVFDAPVLRVGYWFRASDSSFDPPEYYAPMNAISHAAVVLFRYNLTEKTTLTGMGSYGYGRNRTNDWSRQIRANLGVNYRVSDCVNISGGWQYLKNTDYWLRQFSASVSIRF